MAGPADHLIFVQQPANTVAGQAISPAVTAQVVDAFGDPVTADTSAVTLALLPNPAGATLAGTTTVTAVSGLATFPGLSVVKAGSGYQMIAQDGTLGTADSAPFAIAPAAADHLGFGQQPTTTAAGQAISPAVTVSVLDPFGNVVTADTSKVTVALSAGPGALAGTLTAAAAGGVATFANLSITKAAPGYALRATDGALTGATSVPFAITPAAVDHLTYLQQPTTVGVGQYVSPAVTVQVFDKYGNLETADPTGVTVRVAAGPGGWVFGGTHTVPVVAGVATFSDLTLNVVGSGYKLAVSHGTLAGPTSNAFSVIPAATATVVSTTPNPSVYGQAVTLVATVALQGQHGAVTPTGTVTFVVDGVNQSPAALSSSGVASLVTSSLKVGSHTVRALYSGTASFLASSSPAVPLSQVVNKAATSVAVTSSAPDVNVGTVVTFTAAVTAVAPGAGTPTGTMTFYFDGVKQGTAAVSAAGKAVFASSALTVGTHAVTAVYNGDGNFLASPTSPAVTQVIEPLLTATATTPVVAKGVGTFNVTVVARDAQQKQVTSYSAAVSIVLTISDSGKVIGTLSGAFVNGVALFSGVSVPAPGTYVLLISSGKATISLKVVVPAK
jgi:hypothetical protein